MKNLLLTATLAALAFTTAAPSFAMGGDDAITTIDELMIGEHDRRGRGKGRKPRVPGGSGCDDPGDVLEHPECR
jgi:hypothetical protein